MGATQRGAAAVAKTPAHGIEAYFFLKNRRVYQSSVAKKSKFIVVRALGGGGVQSYTKSAQRQNAAETPEGVK